MDIQKVKNSLEIAFKLGGPVTKVHFQEIDPFPMVSISLIFEKGIVFKFQVDMNTVDVFTLNGD